MSDIETSCEQLRVELRASRADNERLRWLLRECRGLLGDYLTPSRLIDAIDRELIGTAVQPDAALWRLTATDRPPEGTRLLCYWPAYPGGVDNCSVAMLTEGQWHDPDNLPDNDDWLEPAYWSELPTLPRTPDQRPAPFPHPGHVTAEEMNRPFGPADGSGDWTRAADPTPAQPNAVTREAMAEARTLVAPRATDPTADGR